MQNFSQELPLKETAEKKLKDLKFQASFHSSPEEFKNTSIFETIPETDTELQNYIKRIDTHMQSFKDACIKQITDYKTAMCRFDQALKAVNESDSPTLKTFTKLAQYRCPVEHNWDLHNLYLDNVSIYISRLNASTIQHHILYMNLHADVIQYCQTDSSQYNVFFEKYGEILLDYSELKKDAQNIVFIRALQLKLDNCLCIAVDTLEELNSAVSSLEQLIKENFRKKQVLQASLSDYEKKYAGFSSEEIAEINAPKPVKLTNYDILQCETAMLEQEAALLRYTEKQEKTQALPSLSHRIEDNYEFLCAYRKNFASQLPNINLDHLDTLIHKYSPAHRQNTLKQTSLKKLKVEDGEIESYAQKCRDQLESVAVATVRHQLEGADLPVYYNYLLDKLCEQTNQLDYNANPKHKN